MRTSDRLRYELLAALATGGLLSFACGGKTGDDLATGGFSGSGSTGGSTTGGAGGSGGISYGGSGGISYGGSGGISTGGVGGIGGSGGISVGGSGGVGGANPIILGTPDCSYGCGAGWITCWQGGTVPSYNDTTDDLAYCPQGYEIDSTKYTPCDTQFYGFWFSGPIAVEGLPGHCCYDTGVMCPGGRPFRVDGELRVADVRASEEWGGRDSALDLELDGATRSALALAWLADARLEHASVAAFARLTLQLMALGAPAELVRGSQLASLDEIEHAELCFGLASRYVNRAFGPGDLDLDGALSDLGLEALLTTTIEEGCIGETVAAMVAGEQAQLAVDARAKAALTRITRDETRHSALAWRIVRWVLEREPSLRETALHTFERLLANAESAPALDASVNESAYRAHGRLSPREQLAAREEAIARVIRPCLNQLLAEEHTESPPSHA